VIRQTLHASCVAVDGRGLLIIGPSGAGKSALALCLISLGAMLVADDQTEVTAENGALIARCPGPLAGLIEARGVGILRSPSLHETPVNLIVDLGTPEPDRLPPQRSVTLLGLSRDLVLGSRSAHFPAAVLCCLRHGRQA